MGGEGLKASLVVDGTTVVAKFSGNAESDDYEPMAKFIGDVQTAATRANATRVVADLRELEFATSSCLKVLAGWVITIEEQSAPYTVEFLSNPQHAWQRRSLRALEVCAPAVVRVKVS